MNDPIKLAGDLLETETETAKCVYCGTENEIIAKLYPGQTQWQVDQTCSDCGERLRHETWHQFEPEQAGMEGLEQIQLTFHIVCEPEDAMRLALLKPETSRVLSKSVAETLALTGRFHVAPLRIVWTREEEPDPGEEAEPDPFWRGHD